MDRTPEEHEFLEAVYRKARIMQWEKDERETVALRDKEIRRKRSAKLAKGGLGLAACMLLLVCFDFSLEVVVPVSLGGMAVAVLLENGKHSYR